MSRNNQATLRGWVADGPYFEMLDGKTPYIRFDILVPRDETQVSRKKLTEPIKPERRDLLRVVEYGARAGMDFYYLKKGAEVVVVGWIGSRYYRDADRKQRRVQEINAHSITVSHGADFARGDRFREQKLDEMKDAGVDLEQLGLDPINFLPDENESDDLE